MDLDEYKQNLENEKERLRNYFRKNNRTFSEYKIESMAKQNLLRPSSKDDGWMDN
jgi:hypothetical protein